MQASYPDSGSVNNSNEGGPEESEEVRQGAGEGGCDSILGDTPLPKHFGQVSGKHCSVASKWDPLVQYRVQMDSI